MPTIADRVRDASDEETAVTMLRELAADRSTKVREAVARNASTPADVLETLVRDKTWSVRYAVAENRSPSGRTVALAASDADVRGIAARRQDIDGPALERLLADPVPTVRVRLAECVDDASIASRLARDPHPAVRAAIVLNPVLGEADTQMLAHDRIARVRSTAAASRRLRPETLTGLATDRSSLVRWHVLVDNPERLDLARILAEDADELNANQARAQLQDPRSFTAFLGRIDLVT
jgi:hypothetical protein